MSRSNLLRRIKSDTGLSASQFMRKIRVEEAQKLLSESSYTISEIAYKVGFSSTSYFIKCFHEHYGYPPGEFQKKGIENYQDNINTNNTVQKEEPFHIVSKTKENKKLQIPILISIVVLLCVVGVYFYFSTQSDTDTSLEKSIAVLPFKNESNDSSNVYMINGLMESLLNNLQKIENIRVISRTSVEKFRHTAKTIPEITAELGVNYIIEGSGQKIDDNIQLNIQLVEAQKDKQLWSSQYNRNTKDIFNLQMEIATNIVDEVEVIISPREEALIQKQPTDNVVAYDYYLQGLDYFLKEGKQNYQKAIKLYEKAIEEDNTFANAYADIAISYYFIDIYQKEKKYAEQINYHAEKAILFDPKLPQSLIAKAVYYIYTGEFDAAVPYLEKAHEYHPNSALVINILSDFYARCIPNTEKYLEYALKGLRLTINDSSLASYTYLHIANSFIQSGFVDEAEMYINKSLSFNSENLYSEYLKAFIMYAKDRKLDKLNNALRIALSKDTSRLDILQEVAKIYFYMKDYKSAYKYYNKFVETRKAYNLNIYIPENAKIAYVYKQMGYVDEYNSLLQEYKHFIESDQSIYKSVHHSVYYALSGDNEKAIEYLRRFSTEENYVYWMPLFLADDPIYESIKNDPAFISLTKEIENKFEDYHERIKKSLKEKGLI